MYASSFQTAQSIVGRDGSKDVLHIAWKCVYSSVGDKRSKRLSLKAVNKDGDDVPGSQRGLDFSVKGCKQT
jgi:hypothetical protein